VAILRRLFLAVIKVAVLLDELAPLTGDFELIEDGVDRADGLAIGTVNAPIGIDVVHFGIIGGLDTIYWTHFGAGRVFNSDAGFGYDEGHRISLHPRLFAVVNTG
jgi:hypothetical protein